MSVSSVFPFPLFTWGCVEEVGVTSRIHRNLITSPWLEFPTIGTNSQPLVSAHSRPLEREEVVMTETSFAALRAWTPQELSWASTLSLLSRPARPLRWIRVAWTYPQVVISRGSLRGRMDPRSHGPKPGSLVAGGKCFSTDPRKSGRMRNENLPAPPFFGAAFFVRQNIRVNIQFLPLTRCGHHPEGTRGDKGCPPVLFCAVWPSLGSLTV